MPQTNSPPVATMTVGDAMKQEKEIVSDQDESIAL